MGKLVPEKAKNHSAVIVDGGAASVFGTTPFQCAIVVVLLINQKDYELFPPEENMSTQLCRLKSFNVIGFWEWVVGLETQAAGGKMNIIHL
jgi:hypothetical protein